MQTRPSTSIGYCSSPSITGGPSPPVVAQPGGGLVVYDGGIPSPSPPIPRLESPRLESRIHGHPHTTCTGIWHSLRPSTKIQGNPKCATIISAAAFFSGPRTCQTPRSHVRRLTATIEGHNLNYNPCETTTVVIKSQHTGTCPPMHVKWIQAAMSIGRDVSETDGGRGRLGSRGGKWYGSLSLLLLYWNCNAGSKHY